MDKARARRIATELQGQRVGGWAVGPYLGSGFSAVVLEANKDGLKAALKIIDPEMVERSGAKKQLTRVLREIELTGHGHPNLVDILDGGKCTETNHLFVAMELLVPLTLGQVRKKIPSAQVGPVIAQLARAARFLEQRGIAHRDIKPDNTVVTPNYLHVKLLDLGVIHPPADPNDPSAGTGDHFVGTARYSPPEFLYREEEDTVECWRAITFYQLGATLFDLLMRQPIFDEFRDPPAKLYQAVKDHIPVIDAGDAEPWLVDLARRCLHKNWQVRKEIVKWEHFEGPPAAPGSAEEIRERLRKRIELPKGGLTDMTRAAGRPTRHTLDQLAGAIATSSRELCRQGGIFPPIEVRHSVMDDKSVVTLQTGPSSAHELHGVLHAQLFAYPLDATADHIRLTAGARLGAPPKDGQDSIELFVGAPSAPALRQALDLYFHAILEASLGTGNPPPGGLPLRPIAAGA